jgi:antitoxin component of RelBE/YafQ-DinJ toxin-antitoxin module
VSPTTIKVDSSVRDQINEIGRAQGLTAQSVIEMLLKDYLRAQRMEAVRVAMRNTSEEDWRTYREETALFATADADGLEFEDWSELLEGGDAQGA